MEASDFIAHMSDIGKADISIEEKIMTWLQLLAGVRQSMLGKEIMHRYGRTVLGGPFKGMELTIENPSTFHLMGYYETPMLHHIEQLAQNDYDYIINLGSSFGYYAVGFAMRIPQAHTIIYEIDNHIQQMCRDMAAANQVVDRFTFRGAANGDDFQEFSGTRALLISDIEGAEKIILDPDAYPALRHMDLVVELHDCIDSSISRVILERFRSSHDIIYVENDRLEMEFPPMFKELPSIDQVVASWDGRAGPTPWCICRARDRGLSPIS